MAKKKDEGHEETDKVLSELEKRIAQEYAQAEKEIQGKLDDYVRRFEIKDVLKQKARDNGQITDQEYKEWRKNQLLIKERWTEMRDTIAEDLTNTAGKAKSITQGYMADVYAINHNYGTFQVEKASKLDTSYTLYDRNTVQRLFDDDNTFYKRPGWKKQQEINEGKQLAWDKKQVQSVMIQAVLQGESIGNIATRLAKTVGESDRKAAIRNARTMITGVENAGRVDSYKRAEDMGIKLQQEWLATLDDRTRHEHRMLDGQRVPVGEKFKVDGYEIAYPGDPAADACMVYNCRCTLVPALDGFEIDYTDTDLRHSDNMKEETYEEWKESHDITSHPITKQDDIANTLQREYNREYGEYNKNTSPNYPKGSDIVQDSVGVEKGIDMDVKDALRGANQNNYSDNCQRSVQAYEFRRRGYDVIATNYVESDFVKWGSECFMGDNYSVENAEKAFTFNCYRSKIEAELDSAPNGARYAIYVDWGNDTSHVFIAEKINGETRYIDPQINDTDVSRYFEHGLDGYYGFFRMDDKEITTDKKIIQLVVEDNYGNR